MRPVSQRWSPRTSRRSGLRKWCKNIWSATCGIMPNDVKIRVLPNNERMQG
jgi:hypothetical protein